MDKWREESFIHTQDFLQILRKYLEKKNLQEEEHKHDSQNGENYSKNCFESINEPSLEACESWITLLDTGNDASSSSTLGSNELSSSPFAHTGLGGAIVLRHEGDLLGRGANSEVYRGSMDIRGMPSTSVAVQLIHLQHAGGVDEVDRWRRVIRLRRTIDYPCFVHCYYIGTPEKVEMGESTDLYLALEVASRGSVDGLLKANEKLDEDTIRQIISDLLGTLHYLHSTVGVVHNDVKPHNILIVPDEVNQRVQYKLTDLDAVCPIMRSQHDIDDRMIHGTPIYMSPENCCGMPFLTSNDVWSVGILTYQLSTGCLPWSPLELQVPSMILHGFREGDDTFGPTLVEYDNSPSTSVYSTKIKDLVRACLCRVPANRPSASALLDYPFFHLTFPAQT